MPTPSPDLQTSTLWMHVTAAAAQLAAAIVECMQRNCSMDKAARSKEEPSPGAANLAAGARTHRQNLPLTWRLTAPRVASFDSIHIVTMAGQAGPQQANAAAAAAAAPVFSSRCVVRPPTVAWATELSRAPRGPLVGRVEVPTPLLNVLSGTRRMPTATAETLPAAKMMWYMWRNRALRKRTGSEVKSSAAEAASIAATRAPRLARLLGRRLAAPQSPSLNSVGVVVASMKGPTEGTLKMNMPMNQILPLELVVGT